MKSTVDEGDCNLDLGEVDDGDDDGSGSLIILNLHAELTELPYRSITTLFLAQRAGP